MVDIPINPQKQVLIKEITKMKNLYIILVKSNFGFKLTFIFSKFVIQPNVARGRQVARIV